MVWHVRVNFYIGGCQLTCKAQEEILQTDRRDLMVHMFHLHSEDCLKIGS